MKCTATRVVTTYSVDANLIVAILSYTQHSLYGTCTDEYAAMATGAAVSKDLYRSLQFKFARQFNGVREYGPPVECDEEHEHPEFVPGEVAGQLAEKSVLS